MTSNSKKIILNSSAIAESNDGNEYRFVLKINEEEKGKSTLHIERNFKKLGEWDSVPSGWYIQTLQESRIERNKSVNDKIFIDRGQNWYVTGLIAALDEVEIILLQE